MKLFILLFLISSYGTSAVLTPKKYNSQKQKNITEILTNVFYEELYKRTKGLKPEVEVRKAKISVNNGRRGKMIIERMKQKNRERIAKMRGFDPSKVKKGADLVKMQKDDNKDVLKKINEEQKRLEEKYAKLPLSERRKMIWQDQAKSEIDKIRNRVLKEHKAWRKKHQATLKDWDSKKKTYKEEIDEYKKTLINIPLILPVSTKEVKKNVEVKIIKDFHFVASALTPEIRDQKFRPTCSSFSGIRAVEILMAQNKKMNDLSEQYFYWASKPNCQTSRCLNKGSWVGNGFNFSKENSSLDIPLEKDCPYKDFPEKNNETQIPLKRGCSNGHAKVGGFDYNSNLDDVVNSLKANKAVIASIKLSPNFYENKGLILDKESLIGRKMDSHASGHAVLLVGYLKLPKILNEGSVCFITANSWGKGWGNGGYSCISEKWLINHRKRNPFVTISDIRI